MTDVPGHIFQPQIGILTALPKEHAAVKSIVDHAVQHIETDHQGSRHYDLGTVAANGSDQHAVVLSMVGVGNNVSAVATAQLLADFPTVQLVVLCGIAGGTPNPAKSEEHVRLGDIVISGEKGIIQFDFGKKELEKFLHRHPPRPANSNLLRAAKQMEAGRIGGTRPWNIDIDTVLSDLDWSRPAPETDILVASDEQSKQVDHPEDADRFAGEPRVFIGAIGSSNILLKDPLLRDKLRDDFGIRAIEMEGSGTADAAWMGQAQHFVVRGICDYCDTTKGDAWQNYAAAAAAGYLKALLKTIGVLAKKKSNGVATRTDEQVRAIKPQLAIVDLSETELSRQLDIGQSAIRMIASDPDSNTKHLVPLMSWLETLGRKLSAGRLLRQEGQAVRTIASAAADKSLIKRPTIANLAALLLERYGDEQALRANWEARCALGNLLTEQLDVTPSLQASVVRKSFDEARDPSGWDLGQMIFDGLHHTRALEGQGRSFFMEFAPVHETEQIRWNVAAALKSVKLSGPDFERVTSALLDKPSDWVVREIIENMQKNSRFGTTGQKPKIYHQLLEHVRNSPVLFRHLALLPTSGSGLVPRLISDLDGRLDFDDLRDDLASTSRSDSLRALIDPRVLLEDIPALERQKAMLAGFHGKLYRAAEHVVWNRLREANKQEQEAAVATYLFGQQEALAWACVRAVLQGAGDKIGEDILREVVPIMLTHPSNWVVRECVEETLRMQDSFIKYLALREIEKRSKELLLNFEISGHLHQIGVSRK